MSCTCRCGSTLISIYLYMFITVSLLRDLKHNNIVTLHDIIHTDKSLTLVFEYLVSIPSFINEIIVRCRELASFKIIIFSWCFSLSLCVKSCLLQIISQRRCHYIVTFFRGWATFFLLWLIFWSFVVDINWY